MRIESIKYSEYEEGSPQEWTIEGLKLGPRNLLVGKNASGKSRALNIIYGLSAHLAGLLAPSLSTKYDCIFIDGRTTYRYKFECRDGKVAAEILEVDGTTLLERGADGSGVIFHEAVENGKTLPFQTPPTAFAAVMRRDALQHKFLEPLYAWASSVRHYAFGTFLGKDNLAIFTTQGPAVNERDPNAAVGIFRAGQKEFGDRYTNAIMEDLARIEYPVNEIDIKPPVSMRVTSSLGELVTMSVREKDLPGITDQVSMSQGMFRTLAMLIHLDYYQLKGSAKCVLIDDIGEGLDFERACLLIDLLREKAEKNDFQLIMATNDRFVMDRVPLEEWSVIQRKANHVYVRNYSNSREIFEEFKFTGLSNFSFFEMDVLTHAATATKH